MSPPVRNTRNISPTAYATGYFWYRHGMSHPALATSRGRRIDRAFRALSGAIRMVSGVSMDALMLARHRGINELLARAIDDGRVRQVIEIAAGLSPRGWEFTRSYGERLTYLETDLPAMAATKSRMLGGAGLLNTRHRVVVVDALADTGPESLVEVASTLDPKLGTAIITEGLMNYLDPQTARGVWRRIAEVLALFPHGLYLADVYPQEKAPPASMYLFGAAISTFVRGRMHIHFNSSDAVLTAMREAGFSRPQVHATAELASTRELSRISGGDRVRILEAWR